MLMLLGLCGAALVFVRWPHTREPVYQGKTLSEWLLAEGEPGSAELTSREEEAVR